MRKSLPSGAPLARAATPRLPTTTVGCSQHSALQLRPPRLRPYPKPRNTTRSTILTGWSVLTVTDNSVEKDATPRG